MYRQCALLASFAFLLLCRSSSAGSSIEDKDVLKAVRQALVGSSWLTEDGNEILAFDRMGVLRNYKGAEGTWTAVSERVIVAEVSNFYAINFDPEFKTALLMGKGQLRMEIHRKEIP